MNILRKSLNANHKEWRPQISTPLPMPLVSKPPSAILPPQKVILAQDSYKSQAPHELSFMKGDFFYVANDADDRGTWYEAHNPVSGARGLVPRALFKEFNKTARPVRESQVDPKHDDVTPAPQRPRLQVFYAIVVHDFTAERADELDAKKGDAITVVAQSNREWFVAKPIGRLGRPGLIPVSFVEIHDPSTGNPIHDVDGLMDRGDLPKVEDWKRAMLNYKQNSIALGVIDNPDRPSVDNSPFVTKQAQLSLSEKPKLNQTVDEQVRAVTPEIQPEGMLLSAHVVSFHFEMDEYWFRIDGLFQPYAQSSQGPLPPAKQLILFRVYNDFYDFQVSLLNAFPRAAGREPHHPRTLPFMPGPAQDVDDALTATRRAELDKYLRRLCDLGKTGARHILEHDVVRNFLALKPGDISHNTEPRTGEIEELNSSDAPLHHEHESIPDVGHKMSRMRVSRSDMSDYDDGRYAASPEPLGGHAYGQKNERRLSPDTNANQTSQHPSPQTAGSLSSGQQAHLGSDSSYRDRSESRWPEHQRPDVSTPSTSSFRSSQGTSSRSRITSSSTTNANAPRISAGNQQTAFVKIKIFDRVADDLIAIRVHPKVSHVELMGKVQARLGGEVANLRYRHSLTNEFVPLDSDEDLRDWMESTNKHVLFAD